ncbi:MAG: RHS repeat-associated core domain-containing protein [Bradyrhizobium sp.]
MGKFGDRWMLLTAILVAIGYLYPSPSLGQASPSGPAFIVHPPRIASLVVQGTPTATPVVGSNTVARPQSLGAAAAGGSALGCASGSSQPAPLVALASALKCDPDLIFEYVYNNIEFEPLYGSNKGALGTLLDRRGNDADQTILLVTLLDIAGYSQAAYTNLVLPYTGTQIANWLGVANDAIAIEELLSAGGIPYGSAVRNSDGTLASIQLAHFMAALQLSGTWYFFDPSFKQHTILPGVSNLASAMGYSKSQFLSDAGGSIDSVSISNINRSGLRNDLVNYATSLVNYINQNNPTWSVGNIVGGKTIQPLTGSPIRVQRSGILTPAFPTNCPNQSPSPECRTYITITMPGASSGQAIKLYTDQVYGHRITIFSQPSGSNFVPTLLIDGAPPSCVAAGTCTNVGPAVAAGTTWSIPVQVVQPNQGSFGGCGSGITDCKTLTIAAGASYLVSLGTGRVGRGMVDYHRQLLAQARAVGNADSSEVVLGESLAVISYGWLAEVSAEQAITDQLAQTTTNYNFGVGITGQANIQQSGFQGPYVDLPLNFDWIIGQHSGGSTITIGGNSYPTAFVAAGSTLSQTSSAFESAILEQTQAPISGMTAASTMKIVDSNMNPAYSGAFQKTFFADGTTAAGQTAYTNTILPQITSNYSPSDVSSISSAVAGGNQILIPQNGKLAVGRWSGAGYSTILPQVGSILYTQKISGGMSGGFTGVNDPDPAPITQFTLPPAANSDTVDSVINTIPAPTNPQIAEPVDGVTGAYIYKSSDLITGSGRYPYALSFSRTYLSSTGSFRTTTASDTGMGNGWSHNWSSHVQIQSDPYLGIGTFSSPAVSAATSIAALYVMQDLMSATPTAQTMTISAMVSRWFTDQLTGNTAIVTQPDTTEEFIALPHPDGTTGFAFNAPSGSSARLNQIAAGQFSYARKDGITANFGPTPAGALQSIVYPNGVTVNLSYSGSPLLLSRVTNNLQRSLSVVYSGSHVSSVTDDSGRSITYAYDGNNNLTGFTNTLGASTVFAYDTSGTFDASGHLTQIFYPSFPANAFVTNWYDALGRVVAQANAAGNISNFYFAGSRTETIDPLSNRHVTYQTDRGRILSDASVLSSSFGDVFNDTVQQNGVVNVTHNQYDGLDRLTATTLPEAGSVSYAYATDVNPWANNVASITRTPKPGFAGSLTTNYQYDGTYNKLTKGTDPLGLIATMTYDAGGNPVTMVNDFGAPPHFNATSRFNFNGVGQVLAATDPTGTITRYAYDGFGNCISIVRDSGDSTHLNILTSFAYNAVGDVIAVTDPRTNVTTNAYDTERRLVSSTSPPTSSAPNGLVTSLTYDPNGQLIQTQQFATSGTVLRGTSTTYTLTGKPAVAKDANGNPTTFAYDTVDRVSSVTDQMQRVTSYAYDALSRQISVSNPAIQSTPLLRQAYTPDGLIASLTNANGFVTNFTPDGFDRLSTTTYPNASTEVLGYDADSNVTSRKTRAGATITLTYDSLNRLATKTAPSEPTVTYSYDLAGRPTAFRDNSASIVNPTTTGTIGTLTSTYDSLNHLSGGVWGPTVAQSAFTAPNATFLYSYDLSNRRISQTATDNSWWAYPTATASTVSYTANTLDQYTAVGSVTPTYDGNGNLTYDGTFSYGYDAESRLISASGAGNSASYAYDAQGRRKSKTVNGTTTIFVQDPQARALLDYDGSSGAIQNWYAFGSGPNDPLSQINVPGSTRATYVPDIQGSVVASLDARSGALTKTGYQTYGESNTTAGAFRYTGARIDAETNGLYNFRARMYSPALGRFMQADPIGTAGGVNLYAYVNNDPLNLTDSSGFCVEDACVIEGGAVACAAIPACSGAVAALVVGTAYYAGKAIDFLANTVFNSANPPVPPLPPGVGPGPFAGPSVPAGPSPRPTAGQQEAINAAGAQAGCHTCGTTDPGTQSGNWIGDHQPPTAINPPGNPQIYLPQCQGCSNTQGGLVRGLTNNFETLTPK